MYKKECDQLLDLVQKDSNLDLLTKQLVFSKIDELKQLLDIQETEGVRALNFLQEFETRYPEVTFCIDCMSRTMSRLGM
jgi:hypothetical protein